MRLSPEKEQWMFGVLIVFNKNVVYLKNQFIIQRVYSAFYVQIMYTYFL